MSKKFNVLDLFSGAGGFSLGFKWNKSFSIKVSIDNNEKLSDTYVKNFPNVLHLNKDITLFDDKEIGALNNKYRFDVIIGGPPCQGFSIAGNNGRLELKDPRNELFLSYLNFVKVIKPKIFVMENVAKLATHNKTKTLKNIIDLFQKIGYEIKYKVLDSSNFEIAQIRKRIFIVGTLKNNNFEFPEISKNIFSVEDAIKDLPALKSGESSNIPNHISMKHTTQMLEKMSYVKEGGDRNDIPENIRPSSGDARKYIRYKRNFPSFCVTGDMRKIFHYSQNRALTNRELARLQSFPDDFVFYGNSINIQQQIGNAVPPKLAYKISNSVLDFLKKNYDN